ncbi:hypothetical protein PPERSA_03348 [Pseudocohnilembus persalinus]|uniref:Uncharacterized protein n=1 Tax=Pseudocohnilembus persalinus TaxID=266149 RepID=A0A0V0R1F4_PSEPJ|nr:hypothetical protein PPERSA_03348 [Pseudocohnilembus persalinus]|eukprot:KRX08354.1 hypothetical protein PPERSA_03348 [Pseudocohnilembus persalinus]
MINLRLNSSEISYKGCRDTVYLNRIESKIEIQKHSFSPSYVNELVEVNILLRVIDKNPKEQIKNVQLVLYNEAQEDKLQMFYLTENDNQKKKYTLAQQIPVEIQKSDIAKSIRFFIRSEEVVKEKLIIEVHYNLEGEKKIKKRKTIDYFNLDFQNPFTFQQSWMVCSDPMLNYQCKYDNKPNHSEQILPFNQLCALKVQIQSNLGEIWIHKIEFELLQQDNFKTIKTHQVTKPTLLNLKDQYSMNLFIQTIKELIKTPIGNIVIYYNRSKEIQEPNELNCYRHRLTDITVVQKNYQVSIDNPNQVQLGNFFDITYRIKNTQQIESRLEISLQELKTKKEFMVSGKTKQFVYLEPGEEFQYTYQILALEVGQFKLPGVALLQYISKTDCVLIHDSSHIKNILVLP